jgi:hypothetical protein
MLALPSAKFFDHETQFLQYIIIILILKTRSQGLSADYELIKPNEEDFSAFIMRTKR